MILRVFSAVHARSPLFQFLLQNSLDITVKFVGDNFLKQTEILSKALKREGSTLVFVNTRVTAEALGHALYEHGNVEVHHGSLSKEVRIDA